MAKEMLNNDFLFIFIKNKTNFIETTVEQIEE